MLEKYEKGFDEKKFIEDFMISKEIATKKDAMKDLRKQIKKESGQDQTRSAEEISRSFYQKSTARSILPGRNPGHPHDLQGSLFWIRGQASSRRNQIQAAGADSAEDQRGRGNRRICHMARRGYRGGGEI